VHTLTVRTILCATTSSTTTTGYLHRYLSQVERSEPSQGRATASTIGKLMMMSYEAGGIDIRNFPPDVAHSALGMNSLLRQTLSKSFLSPWVRRNQG
jgi:hypothetical protein